MSCPIDWIIRVRHESCRSILPCEIDKIEPEISDRFSDYDNQLDAIDVEDSDIFSNSFSTESYHASENMEKALKEVSLLFPEFVFQTEEYYDDRTVIQTNYYRGNADVSEGYIAFHPHHNIKF